MKYICYSCQQQFQQETDATSCALCQAQAIEALSENSSSPNFQVYNIQEHSTSNSAQSNANSPQNNINNQNIPPPFNPFSQMFGNSSMFHIETRVFPQQGQNSQLSVFRMSMGLPNSSNQLDQLNDILVNGGLQQYLNNMMGQPHLTPANSQQINQLEKVNVVKECTICQQENLEDKNGYKLKCSHQFHVECLSPWLQRMNTCPACRQRI